MIYVQLNEANFEYDIYNLIRSFLPREEVRFLYTTETAEHVDGGKTALDIADTACRGLMLCAFSKQEITLRYITDPGEIIDVFSVLKLACKSPAVSQEDTLQALIGAVSEERNSVSTAGMERKECKNQLKLLIYDVFSKTYDIKLPWGTLSGIRPTKIPLGMIGAGASDDEIRAFMREKYRITEQKLALALNIAHKEHEVLSPLHIKNGYSLYIGIPFCPSTCLYCSFTSYPASAWKGQMDAYLDAVEKELDYVKEDFSRRILDTIYIGGGTPTSLSAEQLDRLFTMIEDRLDISNVLEWTVEAGRPDSITAERLDAIRKHPVTRISINPQTMKDETLKLIGRHHTVQQIRDAYALAREKGFDDINMDLIVGLPGETPEDVENTLKEVCKMAPENLTVHSLALKRTSRLNLNWEAYEDYVMESSDELMAMADRYAKSIGLAPYYMYRQKNIAGNQENIGFAKPGKEGIYNIAIMEERQDIVALGAGTSTKRVWEDFSTSRCENVKDVALYMERIDEMIERKRALFAMTSRER